MDWLTDIFTHGSVAQTILILTSISAIGILLGRIKFGSIQLGTSFVFFAAIAAGHFIEKWEIAVDGSMLEFAKTFGLVVFVYTLGLQVGPGFFSSLRKGGIKLNLCTCALVLLTTASVVVANFFLNMTPAQETGLLSGSVTNTPAMIAGQQAVLDIHPNDGQGPLDVGSAYAVAYPFSVLGIIIAIIALKLMFPKSLKKCTENTGDRYTAVEEVRVTNPAVIGKKLNDVMNANGHIHFVTSRLWRNGQVQIPLSDTVLQENDQLLIICDKDDAAVMTKIFGTEEMDINWNRPDIDWNIIDKNLVSRHLRVTNKSVIGKSISDLKLRNKFGVNITRINRAGVTIVPSANTFLQFGDRMTVVGDEEKIKALSDAVGNQEIRLNEPHLVPIFLGLFLGVLLGSIPVAIPGMSSSIKLGIAGGPILMGILMGAFGPRFHLTTYTTRAANLMMRQFGITFFFAALGLSVGTTFVETVFCIQGLTWAIAALFIAIVPALIFGIVGEKFLGLNFAQNIGTICGSYTNPNALAYANSLTENEEPSEAYATVYPLTTILRIIVAQMIVLLASL